MADAFVFTPWSPGGATLAHPLRQIRLIAVSATWYAGGREGGREGDGGREGGRGGDGRGGDCPHFPQTRTFVTAEPSRSPVSRVAG